jgi:hypothetical protein
MKTVELSEADTDMLSNTMGLHTDEIYYEQRKGVAQCFLVFELDHTVTYLCDRDWDYKPVPKRLHGLWRMQHACDLDYTRFADLLRNETWVRCAKVPVTTYEYEIFYTTGKQ